MTEFKVGDIVRPSVSFEEFIAGVIAGESIWDFTFKEGSATVIEIAWSGVVILSENSLFAEGSNITADELKYIEHVSK